VEAEFVQVVTWITAIAIGYLLGSFPSGYLVGRLWGIDVRQQGSGRTGGTNVFRSAGLMPALLTGGLDVAKGALAVWLAGRLSPLPTAQVLAGAAAIVGHNHSLFLGFRGGAGVGTALGALAAIYPPAGLALVVLLLLIIVVTRYASVGSLVVSTAMPLLLLALGMAGRLSMAYVAYGLLAWILIVVAHLPNIRRLLAGTERRLGTWSAPSQTRPPV
jgi:glycerol-3-phosphate acyltransferase PlsY